MTEMSHYAGMLIGLELWSLLYSTQASPLEACLQMCIACCLGCHTECSLGSIVSMAIIVTTGVCLMIRDIFPLNF